MIALACDRCGKQVARGAGYLHLRAADLARAEAARHAWEHDREAELFDHGLPQPIPARWFIHHERCVPLQPDDYWQPLAAIDSPHGLLVTGRYLEGKPWLRDTNWPSFRDRLTKGEK